MKICLHPSGIKIAQKSGIGVAYQHQKKALEKAHIPCVDSMAQADIVQINTIFPASYRAAKKARRLRKKIVYYAHSTMEDFQNSFTGSNLVAPVFKKWIIACYRTADVILTPTPYSKQLLESYHIGPPILALSNGIDLDLYDRTKIDAMAFRKRHGLSEKTPLVLGVGHYIQRKGILDFIQCAKRLPGVQFYWFGYTAPSLVPSEIRNAMADKPDNLHFPGFIDPEKLREAYVGADLFFFPTFEETEGIVLLEAMALETPILVRDISIYETMLPANQTVYKGKSVEEFVQKISLMLRGKLPSLTDQAYESVKKVSLESMGQKLKEIYHRLLEESC